MRGLRCNVDFLIFLMWGASQYLHSSQLDGSLWKLLYDTGQPWMPRSSFDTRYSKIGAAYVATSLLNILVVK